MLILRTAKISAWKGYWIEVGLETYNVFVISADASAFIIKSA